jgi:tetratricopeptide (TPR) repeat protein
MQFRTLAFGLLLILIASPAAAENARDLLMNAAFTPSNKATALGRIDQAIKSADAAVARNPGDQDGRLQRAVAISYRGKVMRSRSDLMAARRGFEAAIASDPRNAEAYLALAGWHLGVVIDVGPFLARTALGASRAKGLEALDRSLALCGDHAFFPAVASMLRIQLDPKDVGGAERLAEAALKTGAPTPMDRVMQRQAATLLPTLRSGNGMVAAETAKLLLPFGRVR